MSSTPGSFEKQPAETFTIAGDFVNVLETDETITGGSSSVVAEDVNGDSATSIVLDGALSIDTTRIKIKVKAGAEDLSPYKITFVAVTSLANAFEIDVFMNVLDT